jgi:serine/threonine-protein phosphatase 5
VIAVKKIVYDEPTMAEVEIPEDAQLTVCGDTHGTWRHRIFSGIIMIIAHG